VVTANLRSPDHPRAWDFVIALRENLGQPRQTEQSHRKFCTKCGGHLMTNHPEMGMIDVNSALLPELEFQPELQVHYKEKVLPMSDGLPKFSDLSSEIGGSNETLLE